MLCTSGSRHHFFLVKGFLIKHLKRYVLTLFRFCATSTSIVLHPELRQLARLNHWLTQEVASCNALAFTSRSRNTDRRASGAYWFLFKELSDAYAMLSVTDVPDSHRRMAVGRSARIGTVHFTDRRHDHVFPGETHQFWEVEIYPVSCYESLIFVLLKHSSLKVRYRPFVMETDSWSAFFTVHSAHTKGDTLRLAWQKMSWMYTSECMSRFQSAYLS